MKQINKMNKGFSLVELAIGLAILTVLILSISLSSGVKENARVQSASQSVRALRSAAESYLSAGNVNYSGVTLTVLKTNNLLPASLSGTGTNPWGGNYTVGPNATLNTQADIALTAVPSTEATKLTSYFNNSANASVYDATTKTWTATF
jgi:prepilin-type N-terminal cleavage/methylation domain-containing protein